MSHEAWKTQIEQFKSSSTPHSFGEYVAFAAEQALIAVSEGNYGVGATYIYRNSGEEYIVGGRNGIISRKDSHLHAEQDAIDAIEGLARGEEKYLDKLISKRDAHHSHDERILVTSLEPCPMCTARILTHKVDILFIANADETSGSLLSGRELKLPTIWQDMMQGLSIITPDTKDPNSPNYIDQKNIDLISDIFHSTRERIDLQMGNKGLSPDLSSLPKFLKKFPK